MFFLLSKVLDVLLSPFTWALALVIIAIPWRRPRRRSRWKRRRLVGGAGVAVFLFFSLEPVSNRLLYRLERSTTSTFRPDVTYDAVVLLGGIGDERVLLETGQPAYNENVERLIATHRLLADGRARHAIISGAPEFPDLAELGEARVLARQIALWGVDAERLIIEDQARNTYENALYSERIARARGFENVLVVTSAFHMRRARECFAAVGMKVDTLSVDYRAHGDHGPGSASWLPRARFFAESTATLREMAGLHIYRLRGYAKQSR